MSQRTNAYMCSTLPPNLAHLVSSSHDTEKFPAALHVGACEGFGEDVGYLGSRGDKDRRNDASLDNVS